MTATVTPRKELYPIIADIIEKRFQQTKTWVSREEIIKELLSRKESASTIESNWKRNLAAIDAGKSYQLWETDLEQYAGNWVDWFSARFQQEGYNQQFKRNKLSDKKWSYIPN